MCAACVCGFRSHSLAQIKKTKIVRFRTAGREEVDGFLEVEADAERVLVYEAAKTRECGIDTAKAVQTKVEMNRKKLNELRA